MKKSTLAEIVAVAVEMNEKLGLKPAIETEEVTKGTLRAELKLNATEMVSADKKLFSATTWNFLANEEMLKHLGELAPTPEPSEPKEEKPVKLVGSKSKASQKDPIAKTEEAPKKEVETPKPARKVGEKNPATEKCNELFKQLIAKGGCTKKEIFEQLVSTFPGKSTATITTMLSDVKNVKYSPFKPLVAVVSDKGIYSFPK